MRTATIVLTVADADTGSPIDGAAVAAVVGGKTAAATNSDVDGMAKLSSIREGAMLVRVDAAGYRQATTNLTLIGDYKGKVTLKHLDILNLTVRDPSAKPFGRVTVNVFSMPPQRQEQEKVTDEQGFVSFAMPDSGNVQVVVFGSLASEPVPVVYSGVATVKGVTALTVTTGQAVGVEVPSPTHRRGQSGCSLRQWIAHSLENVACSSMVCSRPPYFQASTKSIARNPKVASGRSWATDRARIWPEILRNCESRDLTRSHRRTGARIYSWQRHESWHRPRNAASAIRDGLWIKPLRCVSQIWVCRRIVPKPLGGWSFLEQSAR